MKFASLSNLRFSATQFTIPKGKISKERFIPLMEDIPAEAIVKGNDGSAISIKKHIKVEAREAKTIEDLGKVLHAYHLPFWTESIG